MHNPSQLHLSLSTARHFNMISTFFNHKQIDNIQRHTDFYFILCFSISQSPRSGNIFFTCTGFEPFKKKMCRTFSVSDNKWKWRKWGEKWRKKILMVSHWWFVWFDWFDSIVRFGRMFRWNIWRTSWWTPRRASWRWWWIVSLHRQRLTRSTIHMSEWCSRSSWRRWYVDPILEIVRCTRLCTAQIHGRPSIRLNRWCSWCRWR